MNSKELRKRVKELERTEKQCLNIIEMLSNNVMLYHKYGLDTKLEEILEQEFSDCVMSNKQFDGENDKSLDQLKEYKTRVEILESDIEILRKENIKMSEALSFISYKATALGGDEKEMMEALCNIDSVCRNVLDSED